MRHKPVVWMTAAAVLAGVLASPNASGEPPGSRAPYPVSYLFSDAVDAEADHPGAPPTGTNDWACKPTALHPNPIVLVHGGPETVRLDWGALAPLLANNGYCVYALTYGSLPGMPAPLGALGGLLPIEQSAQQLRDFIIKVRAATGAQNVDIVAHSEGSLVTDYYAKFLGGANKIDRFISIGPGWQGTSSLGFGALFTALAARLRLTPALGAVTDPVCAACLQIQTGSEFLRKLSAPGPTVPGVTYTNIVTSHDEFVVPYSSGIVQGQNITNHIVQDYCPGDLTDHLLLPYDKVVAQLVLNALDPTGAEHPTCTSTPPNS
ncbi:alpha/beta fold hydrolase [Nocardia colli]|uniref:Alpha/beta fold hydrolase n=1 Tax=Nocardia colli TaxID=2545717 RepID=A0A5N0EE95_9NOCA|nr:alpha/beta fold hydrolase [Nocardia colli]KAA8887767.1 alpha/beta fold hydrolase [Nocardia colli]